MNRVRLGVSIAGLVLAVAGVLRDDHRIVWVAIILLAIAIVARIVAARRSQPR